MPHLERNRGSCAQTGPGEGKQPRLRSTARGGTANDWPVRAGDKGVAELGDSDQWQKCLASRLRMGNGGKKEQKGEKQHEVEAAMEGTL